LALAYQVVPPGPGEGSVRKSVMCGRSAAVADRKKTHNEIIPTFRNSLINNLPFLYSQQEETVNVCRVDI